MLKLIAIGGGEIGRPGTKVETAEIDRETIKLTGKKHPRLLFVPTASNDSDLYQDVVKKYFRERLGCRVHFLLLTKNSYSTTQLREIVLGSDIVYIGGGSTLKMLKLWRKIGLDKILRKAVDKGIVLTGVSAGANCWFAFSNSDSRKMENPKKDYILLRCLGFVPAVMCPHYDVEKGRQISLKKHMKNSRLVAVALGNCSALEIVGDRYRLITSKKEAVGYKIFWREGKYFKISLSKDKMFKPLKELLKKQNSVIL